MNLNEVEQVSEIRGSEINYSVRLAVTLSTMLVTLPKDAPKEDSVVVDVFWTKFLSTLNDEQKITCRVNSCIVGSQPEQSYDIDDVRKNIKAFFRVLGFVVGIL